MTLFFPAPICLMIISYCDGEMKHSAEKIKQLRRYELALGIDCSATKIFKKSIQKWAELLKQPKVSIPADHSFEMILSTLRKTAFGLLHHVGMNRFVLEQLVSLEVDLNYKDENSQTALHIAIQHRNGFLVKRLLDAKANPETVNHSNQSPLQIISLDPDWKKTLSVKDEQIIFLLQNARMHKNTQGFTRYKALHAAG